MMGMEDSPSRGHYVKVVCEWSLIGVDSHPPINSLSVLAVP